VGLNQWLGAILVTSVCLVGCGKPPQPGGTTGAATTGGATTTTTTTGDTAPATPEPVATSTPVATTTPDAAGTPTAATTPTAGGGDLDDYANAEGQTGFEEVKALTPPASTPELIAQGKEVFAAAGNCVSCHGAEGKGDGPAGAALDPPPRNLHATGDYKYGAGDLAVFRTIKYGVDGTGMAPLEGVLTDEQIWQVTHYVRSIQGS
jgi:mono/diheme cytochrome c family protein